KIYLDPNGNTGRNTSIVTDSTVKQLPKTTTFGLNPSATKPDDRIVVPAGLNGLNPENPIDVSETQSRGRDQKEESSKEVVILPAEGDIEEGGTKAQYPIEQQLSDAKAQYGKVQPGATQASNVSEASPEDVPLNKTEELINQLLKKVEASEPQITLMQQSTIEEEQTPEDQLVELMNLYLDRLIRQEINKVSQYSSKEQSICIDEIRQDVIDTMINAYNSKLSEPDNVDVSDSEESDLSRVNSFISKRLQDLKSHHYNIESIRDKIQKISLNEIKEYLSCEENMIDNYFSGKKASSTSEDKGQLIIKAEENTIDVSDIIRAYYPNDDPVAKALGIKDSVLIDPEEVEPPDDDYEIL
ncbi:MAG: hypothetical protein AAF621_03265, partial [Pseudomonadota bacterium]